MACIYKVKNSAGEWVSFNTKEEALKYAKDNNVANNPKQGEPSRSTKTLANVLRQVAFGENNYTPHQLRVFQEEMLDSFIAMEDQSQFFYKMGSAIALTKGLGKNFDQMQGVMKNLSDLGIGMDEDKFDESAIPFDVRYLLTGDAKYRTENSEPYYHKITANNISIMNKVNDLSRTMFMEQTPSFVDNSNKVVANLKENLTTEKLREIKDDFTAFIQIAAYKKWVEINDKRTSTLRNTLIYDGGAETIVDIVKNAARLAPNNMFLKFILPVNTTTKVGKKKVRNINNKDLINTIEGKTRGKLEPDVMASLMDSFTELYLNPHTQYHAKALFDYLIVKDGLMFKNKSYIKMIPTMMFEDMSKATDIASELLSLSQMSEFTRFLKKLNAQRIVDKEGNYKPYFTAAEGQAYNDLVRNRDVNGVKNKLYEKVFGLTYNQLYNRFEQIYATDVKYQYNLQFVKTKVKPGGASRSTKGITFANENGIRQMTVTMFTDKFKGTEKGSAERSKEFKETIDDLALANVNNVKIDENKSHLEFKKFVRVRQPGTGDATYQTYKLVKVTRENAQGRNEDYYGEAMTAEGDMIPRGITGVYHAIESVGASNMSGVADLGTRLTREQMMEEVNKKAGRDDNTPPENPPSPPTAPVPVTPTAPITPSTPTATETPTETVSSGMFGGLNLMAYDVNDVDMSGMDVTEDDVKEAMKNIDGCKK